MGTTAEKLTYLNETKTKLKDMLNLGGASLTTEPFRQYVDTLKNRYLYFMNNGTQEVWDNWEKVVGEGTTITLNNTEEAPMKIVLKGNTSQEGTPTPEAPQDIHVVSGDNSIEVKGKNLFKNKATSQTINGVVFTVYDDGSVKAEGKATANTALPITGANNVFVDLGLQNGTYRLSGATGGAQNTWAIYMAIKHSDNITATLYNTNGDLAFTKATGDTFFSVIRIENGTTVNQMFYPMIRVANVLDDTYTPYESASYPINLGDIELCKIGTYQDKIFKNTPNTTDYDSNLEDNVWYVKKEIGKVVLDGSETWILNESGTGYVRFTTTESDLISTSVSDVAKYFVISDKFVSSTSNQTVNANADKNRVCAVTNNRLLFKTLDTSLSTAQLWKTWLSSNNVEVRYVLATPTYTLIEDSTLLSQLNALAKSYNSQTNISQESNDLPFIINATALEEMS